MFLFWYENTWKNIQQPKNELIKLTQGTINVKHRDHDSRWNTQDGHPGPRGSLSLFPTHLRNSMTELPFQVLQKFGNHSVITFKCVGAEKPLNYAGYLPPVQGLLIPGT